MLITPSSVAQAKLSIWTISPAQAGELLSNNANNRPISAPVVKTYAAAMAEGRWKLNGQTIVIGRSGRLLNGQHRLKACIQAGVPLQTYVATGVDDDTFDTIDAGAKRTASQILHMDGCKYSAVVAGAFPWIVAISERRIIRGYRMRIPADVVRQKWYENPGIEAAAAIGDTCAKILRPSIGAALCFLFSKVDEDLAQVFFAALKSGDGLQRDNPVYALRERLIKDRMSKAKLPGEELVSICIRAWNACRRGDGLTFLKGSIRMADGTLHFPEIE